MNSDQKLTKQHVGAHGWLLSLLITSFTAASPNVVLFVVDDLGWADNDLDYSRTFANNRGDTDAFFETPHLRDLATVGLNFSQAYASSPVCSPTRASLMLGQSPTTHKVSQFIGGPDAPGFSYLRNLPTSPTTLAEAFAASGYRTGHVGKWHLGSFPTQHGFQQNFGGGHQGLPSSWFANGSGAFPWATGLPADGPQFAGEYLTDRLTRDAVEFIQNAATAREPFFLNMSHYGVHVPFAAPPSLVGKYATKLANGNYSQFDGLTAGQRDDVATYAAMTEAVDNSLGALRTAVQSAGLEDDTLFVFFSDNGGLAIPDFGNFATHDMNAPLRNGKGTLYEGGIRIPMVVAGPGVTPGTSSVPAVGHDLFPTLLASANVPLPTQPLDGVDLSPAFQGAPDVHRGDRPLVVHYPHFSNQDGVPGGAIIAGGWKLIQRYEHEGIELFQLRDDLSETTDVEQASLRMAERLRSSLHAFLADTDADLPRFLSREFRVDPRDAGLPLTVVNGSFEADALPDNTSGDPHHPNARIPTGWSWIDGVVLQNGGVANPNSSTLFGPDFPGTDGDGQNGAMDGGQVVYFGSLVDTNGNNVTGQRVGIEQTLEAVLQADSEYTVRVAAGARVDQAVFVDGLIRLFAGETLLAEAPTFHDPRGLFRERQLVYAYDVSHADLLGLPLTVQLLRDSDGGKVSFDNVRVYQSTSIVDCDFNGDGSCTAVDIDFLMASVARGDHDLMLDLNGDGSIDLGDRDVWLAEAGDRHLPSAAAYLLGDANLDGTVDGLDFQRWYDSRFTSTTAWSAANFNGDFTVDGHDFLIWNANKFSGAVALPEPECAGWFFCSLLLFGRSPLLIAMARPAHASFPRIPFARLLRGH